MSAFDFKKTGSKLTSKRGAKKGDLRQTNGLSKGDKNKDTGGKGVALSEQKLKSQNMAFHVLLVASFLLVAYTVRDFVTPLIFGAIAVGAFSPLQDYLLKRTGWKRKRVSLAVALLIFFLIFLPSIIIVMQLSNEIYMLYTSLQKEFESLKLNDYLFNDGVVAQTLRSAFDFFGVDYNPEEMEKLVLGNVKSMLLNLVNSVNALAGNLARFFFHLLLMLIFIYAVFSEGPRIKKFFLKLFPMDDADEEVILNTINNMNHATLVYNGIGGLIQGVLAGIGFWFAGIGSLTLWTSLMIVLAFIPLLGISMVYIPVCIYLFLIGAKVASVVLFIYCSVVALVTENWFKPMFMGKHVSINPFLMFFAIIGGMSAFGIAGIFYGPIIISVFLTITKLYFHKIDSGQEA